MPQRPATSAPAPVDALFTKPHALRCYLRVEAELANAGADAGVIPRAAADEIASRCDFRSISPEKVWEDAERIGYPIPPLVRQITAACSDEAGQYVHWGATTMDIMDTALALQARDALFHLEGRIAVLLKALSALATRYRDCVMAGRTFGGHAVPITFGFKAAAWLAPFLRHLERVRALEARVCVCELGGATGTLASMGGKGLEIRERFAHRLGLGTPLIAWHNARDNAAELVCVFGLMTGSLSKIAGDIVQMSATEIGEVYEPGSGGRDTSSTMPQKTNPVFSGQVIASASIVAQLAPLALQAMRQQQERSTEGFIEYAILPEAFLHTVRAFDKLIHVVSGARVDEARMRANVDLTRGQIMAEAVMMQLAPRLGRLVAHDVLHDACTKASAEERALLDVLREDPRVCAVIDAPALATALDPTHYLGSAGETVDRVVAEVRAVLDARA